MRRVPVYRQLESNDCGPTCVQMIAHYYGRKYSLRTLKSYFEISRLGCSIKDISTICSHIGMSSYAINVNKEELFDIPTPAIFYYKKGHFVVLEKTNKHKKLLYIIDPDEGRICLGLDEISDMIFVNDKVVCVLLAPNDNFLSVNPHLNEKKSWKLLSLSIETFRTHKKQFTAITLLTFVTMVISWILPMIFRKTIDEGVMLKDFHLVWVLLLSQLLFNVGFVVTNSVSKLLLLKTGFSFGIKRISKYLIKIVDLPIPYFDTRFNSDLIQRIGDQERVNDFIVEMLGGIVLSMINLIVLCSILFYFNKLIFVIFLIGTLISFAYTFLFNQRRQHIDYSLFSLESSRRNSIYETIFGMSDIKINNAQQSRINDWNNFQEKINKYQLKSFYTETFFSEGVNFIDNLLNLFVIGLCAFLVIRNDISIGTMMTTNFLLGQLSSPVNQLLDFSKQVQYAKLSNDRIVELMERPDENNENKENLDQISLVKGINFKNIDFKYSGTMSPFILKNINLFIPHNKITAIVGVSGSGKTTLLKLLLGFYPPTNGELFLGNNNITNTNCEQWRRKCGVVMQNGYIFSGTIADNITMKERKPNQIALDDAIRLACLEDFLEKMPMGIHTKIGETGLPISGGQRQRILIARAIYKNPEYLFFDEATNSLDAKNERKIMENLNDYIEGKTVVIIAHRLSTVKKADNIVVLDKGTIVEQGTHAQLTKLKGKYYTLVKDQLELGK